MKTDWEKQLPTKKDRVDRPKRFTSKMAMQSMNRMGREAKRKKPEKKKSLEIFDKCQCTHHLYNPI